MSAGWAEYGYFFERRTTIPTAAAIATQIAMIAMTVPISCLLRLLMTTEECRCPSLARDAGNPSIVLVSHRS